VTLDAARIGQAVARVLVSLAAGIACGALLMTGVFYGLFGTHIGIVYEGLFAVSLDYGVAIAVFCIPIWLGLAKAGADGPGAAAALGGSATAAFLFRTYKAGSHERLDLMAYTILPYAACGAVAALVTWWVGRQLGRG
jgi:hypothetical protein